MPLTIGITDCKKWQDYERWIKSGNEDINVVRLKAGEGDASYVSHCNGIILTGGEDVYLNPGRDKFELGVLKEAEEYEVPVLGICRGLQIANVYYKGTLVADLPAIGKNGHSAGPDNNTVHWVTLIKESRIYSIIGKNSGEINSHHHQAAGKIGEGLTINAISEDGVVEGLEKAKKHDKEFFMLVQWHPERMDENSPFSGKLKDAFLKASDEYSRYYNLNQSISAAP